MIVLCVKKRCCAFWFAGFALLVLWFRVRVRVCGTLINTGPRDMAHVDACMHRVQTQPQSRLKEHENDHKIEQEFFVFFFAERGKVHF